MKNQYGVFPENHVADTGYASEENYNFLKNNRIDSYIPHQKKVLDVEKYIYD